MENEKKQSTGAGSLVLLARNPPVTVLGCI